MDREPKDIRRRLFTKGGTDRTTRQSPLLGKGSVSLFRSGIRERITLGAVQANMLAWYDRDNRMAGSWEPFFSEDETLVLGRIAGLDINGIKDRFLKEEDTRYQLCRDLVRIMNDWLILFSAMDTHSAQRMTARIRTVIRDRASLALALLPQPAGEGFDPDILDPAWQIKAQVNVTVQKSLDHAFYGLVNGLTQIRTTAETLFAPSMEGGHHDPSAGLFITFLNLMDQVRHRADRFMERYLDFYLYNVLRAVPDPGRPDRAILLFQASGQGQDAWVEKGCPFIRGDGSTIQEQVYRADHDLGITDAKVAALSSLYFDMNPYISPEKEMGFVTGVYLNTLDLEPDTGGQTDGIPLFGTRVPLKNGAAGAWAPARMGLALSSPVLRMSQGERRVQVDIDYQTDLGVTRMLEKRLAIKTPGLDEDDLDLRDLFFKVFDKAFTLSLTGPNGWIPIGDYRPIHALVAPETAPARLSLVFHLGPDMAPVVPWSAEIHGGDYAPGEPVLRLMLNPDAHAFLFSFFSTLRLNRVRITAEVKGYRDLVLYNNGGRLSPDTAFAPFGSVPEPGASFTVGSHETANKNITRLDICVEWELPGQTRCPASYYQGYDKPADTRFEAKISTLTDGTFHPEDPDQQVRASLFTDTDGNDAVMDSTLCPFTRFSLDGDQFRLFRQKANPVSKEAFALDTGTRYGFVRLTLAAPDWGFGHREYPGLLADILTRNALKKKAGLTVAVPNQPWTPMIRRIRMDYRAVSHFTPQDLNPKSDGRVGNRLFHIQPFGIDSLATHTDRGPVCFLPWFFMPPPDDAKEFYDPSYGSLFIGLRSTRAPGVLTLFFDLNQEGRTRITERQSHIFWHYLQGNDWKALSSRRILSDTTQGFLTPGIVTLDIPGDVTKGNNVMDPDLYWLRVSAHGNLDTLCSLAGVHTHGAYVTRSDLGDAAKEADGEKNGTIIERAKTALPGISRISQVTAFFGGRQRETDPMTKNRIRERLRHKMRAVTPWDYERLVLAEFPEVFKVKCFTNLSSLDKELFTHDFNRNLTLAQKPGNVLVVPVAGHTNEAMPEGKLPRLSRVILERIRKFLSRHASPFAKISVENPVYERIRVRCRVAFADRENPGRDIRRLNRTLWEYLSPWHPEGYGGRFGWQIRSEDVMAHISGQPYVKGLTRFSMLKMTDKTRGWYGLFDTSDPLHTIEAPELIQPFYPWSLAVPDTRHTIETVDVAVPEKGEPVGINTLEIGTTFIIDR
ncbi:baseplate J/gp47 family protein [Desulfobacter curvatus]|uniref:baseplate J/gp47 family protein n=1 Tax=Desulfobacter curvatus TaxID=2290 RepID=UPI000374C8A2|nr:baseplate J/gp47 family protein [Desulfobacter curvatus]